MDSNLPHPVHRLVIHDINKPTVPSTAPHCNHRPTLELAIPSQIHNVHPSANRNHKTHPTATQTNTGDPKIQSIKTIHKTPHTQTATSRTKPQSQRSENQRSLVHLTAIPHSQSSSEKRTSRRLHVPRNPPNHSPNRIPRLNSPIGSKSLQKLTHPAILRQRNRPMARRNRPSSASFRPTGSVHQLRIGIGRTRLQAFT